MNAGIPFVIMLRRAVNQQNPLWVYQCSHPDDGAERPTATRDRSLAEMAARQHAADAHPADAAELIVEGE